MNILFSDRYRYFIYRSGCDMRKGYDSLCGIVRSELQKDPLQGEVFIFLSRQRNKIKLLHWQKDGFVIYSKLTLGVVKSAEQYSYFKATSLIPRVTTPQFCITPFLTDARRSQKRGAIQFLQGILNSVRDYAAILLYALFNGR